MNKKNTLLIGLLVIQLAIIGYIYRPAQTQVAPSTPFFSGMKATDIVGISLTDADNKSINLLQQNGAWAIKNGGFPAAADNLQKIIKKILALSSGRVVTQTKSSQSRLQVADQLFNRKITLHLVDGSQKTFYLGSSPSQKSMYFREAGEDLVYVVQGISSWELQVDNESWWQSVYLDLSEEELSAIKVTNSHGTLSFLKGDDKKWQLAGSGSSGNKDVAQFITSLRKMSISTYLGKEKPANLGEAIGSISYTGPKGTIESLEIWPKVEGEDDYVVKGSQQVFYAKIRAYVLDEILKATPELLFPIVNESPK